MFRYINISVFALAIAGIASAGGIDPAVSTDFSSPDGALYSSAACGGSDCSSIKTFSSGLTIVDNPNPFSASHISNYTGSSTAGALSGAFGTCPYSNMFGGSTSYCEGTTADDFLFQGPGTAGQVYTLTFALSAPTTIYGFDIYLQDDSNGTSNSVNDNQHGVTNVQFFNDTVNPASPVTNDTIMNAGGASYHNVYGSNKIELTDSFFAGVTGQTFTFTFTAPASGSIDAPRIWEIDALASPAVPEPGTWMLAGFGMLGLVAATKMRNRRLQTKL